MNNKWGTLIVGVLLSFFSNGSAPADEPAFYWHDNVQIAQRLSKVLKRRLILVVTTDNCVPCQAMKRKTFTSPVVGSEIKRSFVVAEANEKKYPALVNALKVTSFPTTVIIDVEDNRVVDVMAGYVEAKEMQNRLRAMTPLRVGAQPQSRR